MEVMDATLFGRLVDSMNEMDEIVRGERAPSREFNVTPLEVRQIRKVTGLSQAKFAKIIHVQVGTLKNWEQGRRDPTGPAKALLQAIKKDPEHVLSALAETA
jgi:putative transcriptional regulator